MAIASIGGSGTSGLSGAAMSAMREKMAERLKKDMDTDQNGTVSKAEFVEFGKKLGTKAPSGAPSADELFAKADTNGDKELSMDELSGMIAEAQSRMPAPGQAAGARGGAGGPPPGGGGGPPPGSGGAKGGGSASASSSSSSKSVVADPADANGDGKVSASEQLAYELKHPDKAEAASA
jgi:hypothetical protein